MAFTILEKVHTAIAEGIDDENILLGFIDQSGSDSRHSTHAELDEIQFQYTASRESFWTLYRETARDNFAAVDLLLQEQSQYYSKYLSGPFYTFILEKACLQGSNETLRYFLENEYGFSDKPLTVASAAILSPTRETMKICFDHGIREYLSQPELNDLVDSGMPSCDYSLFIKNGAQVEGSHYEDALWSKNTDAVACLLDRGRGVNELFGSFTALGIAVAKNDIYTVELLLRNGANPNHRSHGQTPVHTSIIQGSYEVAEMLLKKGAHVHWLHGDFESPLMAAVRLGRVRILRRILQRRQKIRPRMIKILVELAVDEKQWEVGKILLTYGQKQWGANVASK